MRKLILAALVVLPVLALAQKAVVYPPSKVAVRGVLLTLQPDGGCMYEVAYSAQGTNPGDPPLNSGVLILPQSAASRAACDNAIRAGTKELHFAEFDGGKP